MPSLRFLVRLNWYEADENMNSANVLQKKCFKCAFGGNNQRHPYKNPKTSQIYFYIKFGDHFYTINYKLYLIYFICTIIHNIKHFSLFQFQCPILCVVFCASFEVIAVVIGVEVPFKASWDVSFIK